MILDELRTREVFFLIDGELVAKLREPTTYEDTPSIVMHSSVKVDESINKCVSCMLFNLRPSRQQANSGEVLTGQLGQFLTQEKANGSQLNQPLFFQKNGGSLPLGLGVGPSDFGRFGWLFSSNFARKTSKIPISRSRLTICAIEQRHAVFRHFRCRCHQHFLEQNLG